MKKTEKKSSPKGKASKTKKATVIKPKKSQRITPFFMFQSNAAEAAKFYTSIFKNSKIIQADAMSATFILDGQKFYSYNGGDHFHFSEGISLFISCKNQIEVDHYWEKLIADGGSESMCGWLKDKYGVSWQVVPTILQDLIGHKDREKANRAIQAMLQMRKINIQQLIEAAK